MKPCRSLQSFNWHHALIHRFPQTLATELPGNGGLIARTMRVVLAGQAYITDLMEKLGNRLGHDQSRRFNDLASYGYRRLSQLERHGTTWFSCVRLPLGEKHDTQHRHHRRL
jgi:hypothetical protein